MEKLKTLMSKHYILTVRAGQKRSETVNAKKKQLLSKLIVAKKITHAVIFCNQKRHLDIVKKVIESEGVSYAVLDKSQSPEDKKEYLEKFQDMGLSFLLCVDGVLPDGFQTVANRIINFDCPKKPKTYQQRIIFEKNNHQQQVWTFACDDDGDYLEKLITLKEVRFSLGALKGHRNVKLKVEFSREEKETSVKKVITETVQGDEAPQGKKARKPSKGSQKPKESPLPVKEADHYAKEGKKSDTLSSEPSQSKDFHPAAEKEEEKGQMAKRGRRQRRMKSKKQAENPYQKSSVDEGAFVMPKEKPVEKFQKLFDIETKIIEKPKVSRNKQGAVMGMGEHVPQFMLTEIQINPLQKHQDEKR